MVCNLSLVVKIERILKVIGSHVYFKSGSISKTVLDKNIVTTPTNSDIRPILKQQL